MGRGWYRRRHVDRDVAGILAQTQAAEFTLHILRGRCAARPDRSPFLADEAAVAYRVRRPRPAANGVLAR
jgi:hypothetical protein